MKALLVALFACVSLAHAQDAPFAAAAWAGFFAPKGTPPPVVAKASADLVEVMLLPDLQQRMQDIGSQLVPSSPADFREFVEDEIAKWSEAVKVSGASVD